MINDDFGVFGRKKTNLTSFSLQNNPGWYFPVLAYSLLISREPEITH